MTVRTQTDLLTVLQEHQPEPGHRDLRAHCTCGMAGPLQDKDWQITHQAYAILKSGTVPVAETEWGAGTKWGRYPHESKDRAEQMIGFHLRNGEPARLVKRRAAINPGPWEDA